MRGLRPAVEIGCASSPAAWRGHLVARRIAFTFGVGALLLGLFVAAVFGRNLRTSQRVALACVCAAGLGNLIDRIARDGYVTDFLNLGVGPVRTGIFNVADVILMISVAALLFLGSRRRSPGDRPAIH